MNMALGMLLESLHEAPLLDAIFSVANPGN